MGAVIKYAEYIMGVVFILRMTAFIPSIGSQQNNAKFAEIRKFLKKISTSTSHQFGPKLFPPLNPPQLVAIEMVLKGQDV